MKLSAVASIMIAVLLPLMFKNTESKPQSAVRRTSGNVANEILTYNSDKSWWRSSQSKRPQVTKNPSNIFVKSSKEWLFFVSRHKETNFTVIEIAHKLNNGKCCFLVKKQNGQGIGFSPKRNVRLVMTGEKGLFRVAHDSKSSKRTQISFGLEPVKQREIRFLGFDGQHLLLTTLRHKSMALWTIKLSKSKNADFPAFFYINSIVLFIN